MAEVTAELPASLNDGSLIAMLEDAARLSLDAELPTVLTEIARRGEVPTNRGTLQRAVINAAQPARIEPDLVVADIVVAGEASAYAAVQELGRRPGQPMSWRFLYYGPGARGLKNGWKTGWVNRQMRDAVVELSQRLRAEAKGKKPRPLTAYEARACYLIAVSVASSIRARGTRARKFISGNRQMITKRCRDLVESEMVRVMAEWNAGGSR